MTRTRMFNLLVAAALGLGSPALAAEPPQDFLWTSAHVGQTFFGDGAYKARPHFGLSGGWWFTPRWGVELRGTRGNVVDERGTLRAHQNLGTLTALWRVWPGEFEWQPYLAAGVGSTRNRAYGISTDGLFHSLDSRPELHAGFGAQRRFGEHLLVSLDYRMAHTGLRGTTFNDHLISAGVGWAFGGTRPAPPPAGPPRYDQPRTPPAPPPEAVAAPAPAPPPAVVATVPPAVRRRILLKGAVVHFANDQAVLNAAGWKALEQVAATLKGLDRPFQVKVTGHASKIGPRAHNQRLSLRRAKLAADVLQDLGIPAAALQVEGRGSSEPAAENRSRAGRALNRRAEVGLKVPADGVEIEVLGTDPVTRKVPRAEAKAPSSKAAAKAAKPHKGPKAKAGRRKRARS